MIKMIVAYWYCNDCNNTLFSDLQERFRDTVTLQTSAIYIVYSYLIYLILTFSISFALQKLDPIEICFYNYI